MLGISENRAFDGQRMGDFDIRSGGIDIAREEIGIAHSCPLGRWIVNRGSAILCPAVGIRSVGPTALAVKFLFSKERPCRNIAMFPTLPTSAERR